MVHGYIYKALISILRLCNGDSGVKLPLRGKVSLNRDLGVCSICII